MKALVLSGAVLAAIVAQPVLAADAVAPADALAPYQDGVFSESRWGVSVGGFAGFQPAYEGSDEYRFVGYPLIIPKYYGDKYDPDVAPRVTFRGIDDVRLAALRFGGLDIGPVVGYNFGRDEDDADRIDGLGDIDGGINVGAYVAYRIDRVFADVAYVRQVTGDDDTGHTFRFGVGYTQELNERTVLNAYVNGSYASDDYMNAYFSVSPAQAAASTAGLGVYDADAGFKDIGVDLGLAYKVTDRMTLNTRAGYSRLLNDAADSPVTAAKNQFNGGLGVTYTFGRTD